MAHQFREGILPMRRILPMRESGSRSATNSIKFLQGNYMRHGTNFAKSCHIIRQRFDAPFMHRR